MIIARSFCTWCRRVIELTDEPGAVWTYAQGVGGSGRNPECDQAPNPDDGPMPGHVPGVIAWRDAQPPPPPSATPYSTQIPRIPPRG